MYFDEGTATSMNYYVPIQDNTDAIPQHKKKKRNDVPSQRYAVRVLSRRYALTASGSKFLEIGINVGPASYVEIVIGDNRSNELPLSLESWKALYEQRWNILGGLRKDSKASSISIGPLLTVRFTMFENMKLARLDASNGVCMMMTESTLFYMFNLDQCVDVLYTQLTNSIDKVNIKYRQFTGIASTLTNVSASRAIRSSSYFNEQELLDCELLSLLFGR